MRGFRLAVAVLSMVLMSGLVSAGINTDLYGPYQRLLSNYLIEQTLPDGGLVSAFDYRAALTDTELEQILAQQRQTLARFDPGRLVLREAAIAFWINAYNFFMLDQILSSQPDGQLVSSVWDYGGRVNPFVDNVFERDDFLLGGESYSLNRIEKGILLGERYREQGWKDARVHFAVNCASVGCPPLRQTIYTRDNLEHLLAENTRRALATERHLKLEDGRLHLTELFKWYEQDFAEASGSVRQFVRDWADEPVARQVSDAGGVDFIPYDWTLNRPDNFPELQR